MDSIKSIRLSTTKSLKPNDAKGSGQLIRVLESPKTRATSPGKSMNKLDSGIAHK